MHATTISLRLATAADEARLREALYHAIFVPLGNEPPPRAIVQEPALARYVDGWGRAGDLGLIAIDADGRTVGVAWVRLFSADNRGYAFVDDQTPELSIAVWPQYRGRGVGTRLLAALLEQVDRRHAAVSLSVSAANPAQRLYRRVGFDAVDHAGDSLVMLRRVR